MMNELKSEIGLRRAQPSRMRNAERMNWQFESLDAEFEKKECRNKKARSSKFKVNTRNKSYLVSVFKYQLPKKVH